MDDVMKTIRIIGSKSDAHRALICASLAGGTCRVETDEESDDIAATKRCLAAAVKSLQTGECAVLRCGESGSTLRLLLPSICAMGIRAEFIMEGRLVERPIFPLSRQLTAHGALISNKRMQTRQISSERTDYPCAAGPAHASSSHAPADGGRCASFTVEGKLTPGEYILPGNVSSQFVSGLLLALPLLDGDSSVSLTTELESAGYVDMTIKTMERFGVTIEKSETEGLIKYRVGGGLRYIAPERYDVEGDWSNAAFFMAAGALGKEPVRVEGLAHDSAQGDKAFADILEAMGARVERGRSSVTVFPSKLKGTTVSAAAIPDLVPATALLMTAADGESVITDAGRLRIKESDRLHTVTEQLNALGAHVDERSDGLDIHGAGRLTGGRADSCGDHRIAMMISIASLICDDKVMLTNYGAVSKSYPSFYEKLKSLGMDSMLERI